MHEMAIALALIEQAETAAKEQGARAIPGITVVVGRLSGVDPDALRAVFDLAAEETLAAGATLAIELVEARVRCRMCGKQSRPQPPFMTCVECGALDVELECGRELYIKSMDVDVEDGKSEGEVTNV